MSDIYNMDGIKLRNDGLLKRYANDYDQKYTSDFTNALDLYCKTFKNNVNLYRLFMMYDYIDNDYFFIDSYFFLKILKLLLNYDNNLNISNEEYVKCIHSFVEFATLRYYFTDEYTYEDLDSDFLNTFFINLYKHVYLPDFNDDGGEFDYEIVLEYSFHFAIFRNISMVLGHEFDINNYDCEKLSEVLENCVRDFYDDNVIEEAMNYYKLNNLYGVAYYDYQRFMLYTYNYVEEYVKKKYGNNKKRVIK